ncbi:bifunctional 3-(3-hydroxy-phenyl)propionate/3-hydroxycinnamic acid hydroxylase [Nocardia sp. NPDC057663]|uniref:bifunctional 3-(3-hydroxy-phenyl)propionate/3-hydroxycinnamic acid hydroxylase MhpA n=1 Tax=Nocardia sp. NPDC057663 TaxID=3346201 RepID=UPI003670298C
MNAEVIPVVIIGAGPAGLSAATLLAQYGIESLVLERWEGVYPQPRAVHLDGEIRRVLDRLGVDEEFDRISRPALGLRLVDADRHVLAQFDRDPADGRNGYPEANLFDQPELEELLRANLGIYPEATLRSNAEVEAVTEENGRVRVDFRDRTTGRADSVCAEYVLGCDGANSLVREAIGGKLHDLRFEQRWLVVDISTTTDLGHWEGVHQICDPMRPATYMRIGKTRHRWEFRLLPGETADDYRDLSQLQPLIAPWMDVTTAQNLELVRVADYTFRAQLADRWRRGRIFLLGDAAHLTPPFIGQGMGAGVRDAANLAWKLAGVLRAELPHSVLDTYEIERKPHARAMIRLAKLTGMTMTEGGEMGNRLRRFIVPRLSQVPGLTRMVTGGESPPLHRSELVAAPLPWRGLGGRLIPNVRLADGRHVDEIVAGRFSIVTTVGLSSEERVMCGQRDCVVIDATRGSALYRWVRRGGGKAALVRPDGTVQRISRHPETLWTTLPAFVPSHRRIRTR